MGAVGQLKRIIKGSNRIALAMEAHSALSALIAERSGFSILWASGLSLSSVHGLHDANELSWSQVLDALGFMIDRVTTPILLDGDSGYGDFNNFRLVLKKLDRLGVAGVVIEDKVFPKRNSFAKSDQHLAPVEEYCGKLKAGRDAIGAQGPLIIARAEGFIAGRPLAETLDRCAAYAEAGADAIFIHSKRKDPSEIYDFCRAWKVRTPVIACPTTYCSESFANLEAAGIAVAICANQSLRASIRAMTEVCQAIRSGRALSCVETAIAPLAEVFELLDYDELYRAEARFLG